MVADAPYDRIRSGHLKMNAEEGTEEQKIQKAGI